MKSKLALLIAPAALALTAAELTVAPYAADVTTPLGSPLCFGLVKPAAQIVDPLTARGIVLRGAGRPIVLAAVDWLGISNDSHDRWRDALAAAAGTSPERVSVHVLHQHDAPGHDDTAARLLREQGLPGTLQDDAFNTAAIERTAAAVRAAQPRRFTHIGTGRSEVKMVASNRRILGDDGKVRWTRMSSSRIPEAVAAPEGAIDPFLESISFWDGESRAVAVLTYYATHPQSHYGQGGVGWEFVGMARAARERALPGVAHIHFNGAGGNVAAGKYNDGAPEKRAQLAARVEAGMAAAWEATRKTRVKAKDIGWITQPVALPLRDSKGEAELRALVNDAQAKPAERMRAARDLSFTLRSRAGHRIQLSRLHLGPAETIYLPGELFIEYQLAARRFLGGERTLGVAAYGDLGPGYIGTEIAYGQGGYETGVVSRTAPSVEGVLTEAIRRLVQQPR